MKSFLKQINESFRSLDEKDWDGDGEQESSRDEYMGVKDKAIKRAMKKEVKGKYDDGDGKDEKCDHVPCNEDISICEICGESLINEEELEEMSTSAGVAPITTPYAFSKKEKKKMKYPGVAEAMDHKYEQLIEGYRDFALGNGKRSPNQTVNNAIREVAKQLKSIEETIKYTSRLKTESGISHSGFSSGTHNALRKISERLIKISERVRSLGE